MLFAIYKAPPRVLIYGNEDQGDRIYSLDSPPLLAKPINLVCLTKSPVRVPADKVMPTQETLCDTHQQLAFFITVPAQRTDGQAGPPPERSGALPGDVRPEQMRGLNVAGWWASRWWGCRLLWGAVQLRLQDLELGRPGIWLRIDLEKPPSTQMSCPVT